MNDTAASRHSAPTILIVDDVSANIGVLADYLGAHGFSVMVAQDGEEGVGRAQFGHPDLILLDVMMPGIDGFEACRRLKAGKETQDIPVIFMTALSETCDKVTGYSAGGVDYVTKPFHLEEVLVRVNTHLALQSMRRQLTAQNLQLKREMVERERIDAALQRAHDELEKRVAQRTAELARANADLQAENNERKRAEEELRERDARIRRLLESNIIGIFFWNIDGAIEDANDAFLGLSGYSRVDLQSGCLHWSSITPPEYLAVDQRALEQLKNEGTCTSYEKEFTRKNGTRVAVLIGAAFFEESQERGVAFVLDLSARKLAEQQVHFLAHHDALTGLPNRTLLQDRMKQAIAVAHRNMAQVAVFFIDLDSFKRVNDSLGHQIGDRLLQMVATRLLHCLREGDSLARLGGDEFMLAMPMLRGSRDAVQVAQKVLGAIEQAFFINGNELHIGCSIGISIYPEDGADVETLMRCADMAMYHAKEKGRSNFQFFTAALNQAALQRLEVERRLRHAFAHDEFILHYQPQVDIESGAIVSAEALLRWRQPGEPPISCGPFIASAEETGLILLIGDWVLREACRQLRHWHDAGHPGLRIAVNLSSRQFDQPNFGGMIEDILAEAGVPASAVELEITESILLRRSENNLATLNQLKDMGIQLSVDDFGTGYSSLAYLQRFPVHALKIDQSFVRGIGTDRHDTAIVTAIIAMANSLNLNVMAEGVETLQQAQFLLAHNCPAAQGFYYSKAVSPEEFFDMLDVAA